MTCKHLLNITLSGYLPVGDSGQLYFIYYEAQDASDAAPIVLWLQGGPGCASSFGSLYELGPRLVQPDLTLAPNPGTWNRKAALLFIDQPVGTGFSTAGKRGVPENEMEMAADLYAGLQRFFKLHPHLGLRPLIIAGESYAGKYVPSIGHLILQQEAAAQEAKAGAGAGGDRQSRGATRIPIALKHTRPLPQDVLVGRPEVLEAPLFRLKGLIIVSGLTDPAAQVGTHAAVAHAMGLIDDHQRAQAEAMQAQVKRLVADGLWEEAHSLRGDLLGSIAGAAGAATLMDVRRSEDYDAGKTVDRFWNQDAIKELLGVPTDLQYESCSERVGEALGRDVMKSVKYLIPDLLDALPIFLVQGQHDIQDGPPSTEAWLRTLEWSGRAAFENATREVVRGRDVCSCAAACGLATGRAQAAGWVGAGAAAAMGSPHALHSRALKAGLPLETGGAALGVETVLCGGACQGVVAYWKAHGALTHAVVRDAGHMVPRDAPKAAQYLVERWLKGVLAG
ncbi:hypothetical protein N2152v2_007125 [Parachlorella kessleri]